MVTVGKATLTLLERNKIRADQIGLVIRLAIIITQEDLEDKVDTIKMAE